MLFDQSNAGCLTWPNYSCLDERSASVCMLTKEEEEVPTILVVLPIIMRKICIISPRAFFPIWLHDAQPNEIVMCLFTFCTDFVDDRLSLACSSSKDVSWKSIWDYIDLKQYWVSGWNTSFSPFRFTLWSVMGSMIDKLQFCRCRFAVCLVLSCSVVCADLMNGGVPPWWMGGVLFFMLIAYSL